MAVIGSMPLNWQDREKARFQKSEEHLIDEHNQTTTKPLGVLVGGYFTSSFTTFSNGDFVPFTFDSQGNLRTNSILSSTSISIAVDLTAQSDSVAVYGSDGTTSPKPLSIDTTGRLNVNLTTDVIGTHDSAVPSKVLMIGQYGETTIPTEVADGDVVRAWYDSFGRQITFGSNLGLAAIDVNDVSPAQLLVLEATLLNAVTTIGASTGINTQNYNKHTIQLTGTSVTGAVTTVVQGSLDNTNWFDITNYTLSTSITNAINITNNKYKYMRANITMISTSATMTVKLLSGN